jgi:hypothetical protein
MTVMQIISFMAVPTGTVLMGVAAWYLSKSITRESRHR